MQFFRMNILRKRRLSFQDFAVKDRERYYLLEIFRPQDHFFSLFYKSEFSIYRKASQTNNLELMKEIDPSSSWKKIPGWVHEVGGIQFVKATPEEFLTHKLEVVRYLANCYLDKEFDWIRIFIKIVNEASKRKWSKMNIKRSLENPRFSILSPKKTLVYKYP